MGLIRSFITLALVIAFLYVGAAVPLGERTLFQHIARIWKTEEAKELREGVKETSGPVMERIKRGVQAGVEEVRREQDGGVGAPEIELP